MATSGLTADEFATWLTPYAARKKVSDAIAIADPSKIILERLKGCAIRAAAIDPISSNVVEIPAWSWSGLASEDFWSTGDGQFLVQSRSILRAIAGAKDVVRYFAIKLETAGIDALIESLPTSEGDKESKGPPVPEPRLREWHALYQKTYTGSEDTEARALESAKGMFPGRFVSRDQVRALFPNRSRGRKGGDG